MRISMTPWYLQNIDPRSTCNCSSCGKRKSEVSWTSLTVTWCISRVFDPAGDLTNLIQAWKPVAFMIRSRTLLTLRGESAKVLNPRWCLKSKAIKNLFIRARISTSPLATRRTFKLKLKGWRSPYLARKRRLGVVQVATSSRSPGQRQARNRINQTKSINLKLQIFWPKGKVWNKVRKTKWAKVRKDKNLRKRIN